MGLALSKSFMLLCNSFSVLNLKSCTRSLLFNAALIYSSVSTNFSNSPFKSLFYYSKTLMCYCNASISAFRSEFLSNILELLNLTSSISLLAMLIYSSLFLMRASKSYKPLVKSRFLPNSSSLNLPRLAFSSNCLSIYLYNY